MAPQLKKFHRNHDSLLSFIKCIHKRGIKENESIISSQIYGNRWNYCTIIASKISIKLYCICFEQSFHTLYNVQCKCASLLIASQEQNQTIKIKTLLSYAFYSRRPSYKPISRKIAQQTKTKKKHKCVQEFIALIIY